ncbi:hypothetical protein [Nonomuraea sp. NPDC050643]|uniref:hypothetical protein n=1 Tax=Nonomuraea sp. NPDC050643 TaxID=3155660 RepID=UPI0033E7804E
MRLIRPTVTTLAGLAILAVVGWPGEAVRPGAGVPVEPWRPPGRGTAAIDVLGPAPHLSELFGDVAVTRQGPG